MSAVVTPGVDAFWECWLRIIECTEAQNGSAEEIKKTLNNLATLYDDQSRYAEAEQLYVQARAIAEKALGSGHPLVATIHPSAVLRGRERWERQGEPVSA